MSAPHPRTNKRESSLLGAATLLWLVVATAFGSACQNNGGICTEGLTPCGQIVCARLDTDALNCGACGNVCGETQTCVEGACVCAEGTLPCANGCAAALTDETHCGGCGVACLVDQVCENGSCTSPRTCQAGTCN